MVVSTFFVQVFLLALNMRFILSTMGYSVSVFNVYPIHFLTYVVNYLTPVMDFGGEPVELGLLKKRYKVSFVDGFTTLVLEDVLRITMASFFIVAGASYVLVTYTLPVSTRNMMIILTVLFLLFLFLFYRLSLKQGFFTSIALRLGFKDNSLLGKYLSDVRRVDANIKNFLKKDHITVVTAFTVAFLAVSVILLRYYLVMVFLGYSPRISDVLFIFTVVNFIVLIPVPASLGVFEGSQALVFKLQHIGSVLGLAFSLILRAANLVLILPAAVIASYYGLRYGLKLDE